MNATASRGAGALALAVMVTAIAGCTDAATRVAKQIESEVGAFSRSQALTHSIRHLPDRLPEGCWGPYTLTFEAGSSVMVQCRAGDAGRVTSRYGTTYHRRFVQVPTTLSVDKAAGEPVIIELEKRAGEIVVVGLR